MKRFGIIYFIMLILVAVIFIGVNIGLNKDTAETEKSRNVIVNRIAYSVQQDYYENTDINGLIEKDFYEKIGEYKKEYKAYEIPTDI